MDQLINNLSILIFLVMMLIMAVAVAAMVIVFQMKKNNQDHKKEAADMSKVERRNAEEVLPIEDIREHMIIEKGGNRFCAVITCVGNDFYTKSLEEQVTIQNNYIDFIFALKEPIMFRQYDEGVNMDYTLKKLSDAYKSLEEELFNKMEDFKENQRVIQDLKRTNDPNYEEALLYMEQEKEALESLQWRLEHIKEECAYLENHSHGTSGTQKQKLTYVVSWSPTADLKITADSESIYETAKRELDRLCKVKIRQLSDTGAIARRCTTRELVEICRRHSSPVSANRFTMQQILSSTYFDDVVTTDMTDKRNERFEDDMIRKLLAGDR